MKEQTYKLLDGKATSAQIKQEIAAEVAARVAAGKKAPHLVAILVGHDGGSETYVAAKIKTCAEAGFRSSLIRFEDDVTEERLLSEIERLNNDPEVHGFIVQLPLPKHINEQRIIEAVNPSKDVDGFHPINVGRMAIGLPCFISATPLGILTLLQHYHIETSGKKCVILGRSNIVGKPMAQLMMQKQYGDSTVTVCHSRSKDLKKECQEADIIIAAIGRPEFVTADMVKWKDSSAACVILASKGYPETSSKGDVIHGDIKQHDTTIVFHSGTKLIGDEYVTNGGRVLGVVGLGKDLRTALDRAYGRIEHIDFEGMQYRTDIGAKAFK